MEDNGWKTNIMAVNRGTLGPGEQMILEYALSLDLAVCSHCHAFLMLPLFIPRPPAVARIAFAGLNQTTTAQSGYMDTTDINLNSDRRV